MPNTAYTVVLGLLLAPLAAAAIVYNNDFQGPVGSLYPEWTSPGYTYTSNQAGTIAAGGGAQVVTNVDSPNGRQRFLGEFGGPAILSAPPYDPQHFVRVDQTVRLTLGSLAPHSSVTVSFDLYILKSWDGNNPNYGPDRWRLSVAGGPTLFDTTFSNNFKTGAYDLSLQNYPVLGSQPRAGAAKQDWLGYTFYGDSAYHLTATFVHSGGSLILDFSSSMFEGKGTADESWGLDNVVVSIDDPGVPAAAAAVNGASLKATISSGSWVTIFGSGLASAARDWVNSDFIDGRLPTQMDGVSVSIDGKPAYIGYLSPGQINVIAPADDGIGPVPVEITTSLGRTSIVVEKQAVAPALFALKPGGRYVAAEAQPGDSISLFATGLGATAPAYPEGEILAQAYPLAVDPVVLIAGEPAGLTSAALVSPGIYELDVVVPSVPDGDAPVIVQLGSVRTPDGAFILVKQ
jgi:uncharacterized protein (TIGR03437 family)